MKGPPPGPEACYFCEATEELEEHHIIPQRFDGGDKESNIVTLCHDCHWKLERLYNKDFWEAIGIEDPRAQREKHIMCAYQRCTNQATERHSITATTGTGYVYRCDEHHPGKLEEEELEKRAQSLQSIQESEQEENTRFTRKLKVAFAHILNNEPTSQAKIRDTFDREQINSVYFPNSEDDHVTKVGLQTVYGHYTAEYRDGQWTISYTGGNRDDTPG